MLKETKIFAKVHKKLAKYGFILRFPEGKDEITGYAYEPWHFRYVGSPKIAEEITEKGITFEEYIEQNK
jgi:D-alanyl-D-alanine carboxypeptidase